LKNLELEIKNLQTELDELKVELEQASRGYNSFRRDMFFVHALGGGFYPSIEHLSNDASLSNIDLSRPDFVIFTSRTEKWGPLFADETNIDYRDMFFILRNVLEDVFDSSVSAAAAEYMGYTVVIVNFDSSVPGSFDAIKRSAVNAIEFLETNFDISITIAASRVYSDAMKIPEMFNETLDIFEYQQLVCDDDVQLICYDDLLHTNLPPSSTKYLSLETKMLNCIQTQDFDGLRQSIHELVSREFIDTQPSINTFKFRIYGMVNSMLYMTDALKDILGFDFYMQLNPGHRLVESGRTLNDFLLTTDAIIDEIEEHFNTRKKEEPPQWVVEIDKFIDENFRDFNLSVNYIADRFNLSPAYCSRIYRQYRGERLFDALQKKRLEAAKQMLSSTDTVKDIADSCGFSSSLTMNRAFKRYEGVCPSKLRG